MLRLNQVVAIAAGLLATTHASEGACQSRELPYQEGDWIPPGYHVESDLEVGVTIAGAAIWAVTYGVGIAVAASYDFEDQGGWFFLPAAGPFVYLGARSGCSDDNGDVEESVCDFGEGLLGAVTVIDGLVQTMGIAVFIGSLVAADDVLIADDIARRPFLLLPAPQEDGAAIIALGTF